MRGRHGTCAYALTDCISHGGTYGHAGGSNSHVHTDSDTYGDSDKYAYGYAD
jgi:hypothetical protein